MVPRRLLRVLGALTIAASISLAPVGCGEDTVEVQELTLSITSDPPGGGARIGVLRILLNSGDTRWPSDPTAGEANFPLSDELDPVQAPVLVGISFGGDTFGATKVRAMVLGLSNGAIVAAWEGDIELSSKAVFEVRLDSVGADCDEDLDGFLDCGVTGCCDVSDSQFADCEPASAEGNPYGVEDECEPCSDTIDQDCDGADVECTDSDQDGTPDCQDCEPNNGAVGQTVAEICDDVDNNCDGSTDEGLRWQGLEKGAQCGLGVCDVGVVECDEAGGLRCSSSALAGEELCGESGLGDGLDNDCDGATDEGCSVDDLDGDGYGVNEEPIDCNDLDSSAYPDNPNPEPCCPPELNGHPDRLKICDKNCDGDTPFCSPNDADGDGVAAPSDCDDTDPLVYPGAPQKCGDGIDQDCFGGDEPCEGFGDADGDGWAPPADCDDTAEGASINPDSPEICDGIDNDCNGYVDDGNPVSEETCGSDVGECEVGPVACSNTGGEVGKEVCLAKGPTPETCDGQDDDCDGDTDEDFKFGGASIGGTCDGLGICGSGKVECNASGTDATCSTMPDGSNPGDVAEKCDGLDNDCDGVTDESLTNLLDSTCSTKGVCGAAGAVVVATCVEGGSGEWDCDYSGVPNYTAGGETSCDGLDNDCDGFVDEDFDVGKGCDGPDPDVCESGTYQCADDQKSTFCEEEAGSVSAEICDGKDNDCDGETDEDFTALGEPCDGDDSDQCETGTFECAPDGQGVACLNESQTNVLEICDGQDNDCDGQTDEDFPSLGEPCDGQDSDFCKNGTFTCMPDGSTVQCVNESPEEIIEVCDGADNDCDGDIDENALVNGLGEACDGPADADLCLEGVWVCRDDGSNTEFDCDEPAEDDVEVCDGQDNDCDLEVDEGLGVGVECDSDDSDECVNGTTQCVPGDPLAAPVCVEAITDIPEVCDPGGTFDEDCDGSVNEDWPQLGAACDSDDSDECETGTWTCNGAGSGVECVNETLTNLVELCNNADDDCDGDTDEELTSVADAGCDVVGACSSQTTALCSAGDWSCTHGSPDYQQGNELGACDDVDNDCDGGTDEDFGPTGTVKYLEPDGITQRFLGQACGLGECAGGTTVCDTSDPAALTCTSLSDAAPADLCDGQDDDCDGQTDEEYGAGGSVTYTDWNGAELGKGQTCGTGLCANGQVECGTTTTLVCSNDGLALPNELCNNVDDDCDGATDERWKSGGDDLYVNWNGSNLGLGGSCGTGACAGGTVVCAVGGATSICSTDSQASTDVCDGEDNNCDGVADDPFIEGGTVTLTGADYEPDNGKVLGDPCGIGACLGGVVVCDGPNGLRCSTDNLAGAEICDGQDNNCNGNIDEGFLFSSTITGDSNLPVGATCAGTGGCSDGVVECASASQTACSTMPAQGPHPAGSDAPTQEDAVCDGVDGDCDGDTDEFFGVDDSCLGEGECGAGVVECLDENDIVCSTDPGGSAFAGEDETCNGLDDDCDGSTDEFLVTTPQIGTACDAGACGMGTYECNGAGTVLCSAGPGGSEGHTAPSPNDAVCNDIDDDCDGDTDEDVGQYSDFVNTMPLDKGEACDGQGECSGESGVVECNPDNNLLRCSANNGGVPEDCQNGLDDDCDGTPDPGDLDCP